MIQADINGDWKVDSLDINTIAANWQKDEATRDAGDVTGDGKVDALDLNAVAADWQHDFTPQWTQAQEQTYTGPFYPGIAATHPSGIKQVRFFATPDTVLTVTRKDADTNHVDYKPAPYDEPAINPQTGNEEYYIFLNAGDSPNGRFTLNAVVDAEDGSSFQMPTLFFNLMHWPENPQPQSGTISETPLVAQKVISPAAPSQKKELAREKAAYRKHL